MGANTSLLDIIAKGGPTVGMDEHAANEAALARSQALTQQTQQATQGEAMKNQITQRALRDQDALMRAWRDVDPNSEPGTMANQVMRGAIRNGASPDAVTSVQKHFFDLRKTAAETDKDELANQANKHDTAAGMMNAVINAPPDRKEGLWAQYAPHIQPLLDKGETIPQQYPGDDAARVLANVHVAHSKQIEQAFKEAQTKKELDENARQQQQFDVNKPKLQAEAAGAQLATAEKQRQADAESLANAMRQGPDKFQAALGEMPYIRAKAFEGAQSEQDVLRRGLSASEQIKTPAAATPDAYNALIDQMAPSNVQGNQALNLRTKSQVAFELKRGNPTGAEAAIKEAAQQMGRIDIATDPRAAAAKIQVSVGEQKAKADLANPGDAGLDMMAEKLLANQPIPMRNAVMTAQAYKRAGELAKERGLTAQQAVMEGNAAKNYAAAYNTVTKQYETLKPFAEMAEKNADVLEKKMQDVTNLGAPFLNTPIREIEQKFGGNTNVTAFKAAMMPVQADFARILNSPNGGGVLSDNARHEMQAAISPGATPGQIKAALDVFRTDARNRKQSYEQQLQDLKGKTVVTGNQPQTQNAAGGGSARKTVNNKAEFDALPSGSEFVDSRDGKPYRKP